MTIWTYNLPDETVDPGVLRVVVDGVVWPNWLLSDMPGLVTNLEATCGDRPIENAASIVIYWNPKDLEFLHLQSPSGWLH